MILIRSGFIIFHVNQLSQYSKAPDRETSENEGRQPSAVEHCGLASYHISVRCTAPAEALPITSVCNICSEQIGYLDILFHEMICLQTTDIAARNSGHHSKVIVQPDRNHRDSLW
jgi:hypothetical protein